MVAPTIVVTMVLGVVSAVTLFLTFFPSPAYRRWVGRRRRQARKRRAATSRRQFATSAPALSTAGSAAARAPGGSGSRRGARPAVTLRTPAGSRARISSKRSFVTLRRRQALGQLRVGPAEGQEALRQPGRVDPVGDARDRGARSRAAPRRRHPARPGSRSGCSGGSRSRATRPRGSRGGSPVDAAATGTRRLDHQRLVGGRARRRRRRRRWCSGRRRSRATPRSAR